MPSATPPVTPPPRRLASSCVGLLDRARPICSARFASASKLQPRYFFVVELLDAASFWQSVRNGILESRGRTGAERETQLKDLLWGALVDCACVTRRPPGHHRRRGSRPRHARSFRQTPSPRLVPTRCGNATRRSVRSCCSALPIWLPTTSVRRICIRVTSTEATTVTSGACARCRRRHRNAFATSPG